MPTFKARYQATCTKCGKPIEVGQYMNWAPRKANSKTHFDCENVTAMPESTKPVENPSTPTTPNQTNALNALASALNPLLKQTLDADAVRSIVAEELSQSSESEMDASKVQALIQTELAKIIAPREIVVTKPDMEPVNVGIQHKQFDQLLSLCNRRKNVFMYGASGGGKTHVAASVAKALSLKFYTLSLNIQSTPSLIKGFQTANGSFAETDYYKWYVNGGVFLFDEYANASGNLQTALNTDLANGHASFPVVGLVPRHPDAICLAADNTVGLGSNGVYSSRQQMDAATRERFLYLKWEYDTELEMTLAKERNPKHGETWCIWIQLVRMFLESINSKLLATPRASIEGSDLLNDASFTTEQIADLVLFKGIDSDTRHKVLTANPLPRIQRSVTNAA